MTSNIEREGQAGLPNILAKPTKVGKNNKYGNPDSFIDSLVSGKEMLIYKTLPIAARSGHNGRLQAKTQTILC